MGLTAMREKADPRDFGYGKINLTITLERLRLRILDSWGKRPGEVRALGAVMSRRPRLMISMRIFRILRRR
jgi:hypothetical protein